MVPARFRFAFLLAVAVVAAAIGDPLVETISNSGMFGPGYRDNNHLSVVPALVGGAWLLLALAAARCRPIFAGAASLRRGLLAQIARERAPAFGRNDIAFVLLLQIATLFTMESGEQIVLDGRLLGGTAWLGGPVGFSLAAHAIVGGCCTLLFANVVRWICATVASLVCDVVEAILFSLARGPARACEHRLRETPPLRAQAPHVRQIGGRAPPRHLLAA